MCAALTVLALAVRLWGLRWGLPTPDEEATPMRLAWRMWGHGAGGFDPNPHFFKYPSLTVYLHLLGQALLYPILVVTGHVRSPVDFRVIYETDPTPFYVMGRSITALLGALTVVPALLLARRVAGNAAAVVAGLLVALSVPLVSKSQTIEVDVPLTLFVTLALFLTLRLAERPSVRTAIATGAAVGLAGSAKYPGLFALAPALAAVLLAAPARPSAATPSRAPSVAESRRRTRRAREREPRRAGAHDASRLVLLLAVVAGAAAAFTLTSPFVLLDWHTFQADLAAEREHMQAGHFGTSAGTSWGYYAAAWLGRVAGVPVALLAAVAIAALAIVRRDRRVVLLATYAVLQFVVVGQWAMKADRYLLPLIPVSVVLAVAVVGLVVARLPSHSVRAGAWAVAFAILAWPDVPWSGPHLARMTTSTQNQAKAWIEAHVPAGSSIAEEMHGPELLQPLQLETMDPAVREAICRRGRVPVYAIQQVPMYQVGPERSSDFYAPAFVTGADYLLVTSAVRDRYRAEPARFATQTALYDTLERRFTRVRTFREGIGPEIVLYRNPSRPGSFAQGALAAIPRLTQRHEALGGEAFYYLNLGVNLEAYGHLDSALVAYAEGLRFGSADVRSAVRITQAIVRVRMKQGRSEDALAFLAAKLDQARSQAESDAVGDLVRQVRAGTLDTRPLACGAP